MVKENECKEKKKYDWYASKEENTDAERIIDVRKELRVQERNFGNFQVERRMKVIKEIHKCFGRFFYQE